MLYLVRGRLGSDSRPANFGAKRSFLIANVHDYGIDLNACVNNVCLKDYFRLASTAVFSCRRLVDVVRSTP